MFAVTLSYVAVIGVEAHDSFGYALMKHLPSSSLVMSRDVPQE